MATVTVQLKILGPGCTNCKRLAANAEAAAREMELAYELEKVTDIGRMIGYGIRRTPALVINDKVAVEGRVPSPEELMSILAQHTA